MLFLSELNKSFFLCITTNINISEFQAIISTITSDKNLIIDRRIYTNCKLVFCNPSGRRMAGWSKHVVVRTDMFNIRTLK